MEPRGCIASYDPGTARLSVQIGSQGVHQQAMRIAHALDLPLDRVRVTTGDVGGGFGARSTTYPEYIACAYAAYKLGRAIRWCASRSECFISDTQARDHATRAAMAFDRDGKILALRVHGRCNMGAHVVPRQPRLHGRQHHQDAGGRLRCSGGLPRLQGLCDQHHTDQRLSWRRPVRRHLCRRATYGQRSAAVRPRPRGDPPAESGEAVRNAVHDTDRRNL